VDFTAVAQLAAGRGFRTVSLTTQSEFLVAAGLEAELRVLQASPDLTLADYTRARSGIVRMLDPRHMGRFRVLTLERETGLRYGGATPDSAGSRPGAPPHRSSGAGRSLTG
jgi:SAM-dependent MidA family methyltransferase